MNAIELKHYLIARGSDYLMNITFLIITILFALLAIVSGYAAFIDSLGALTMPFWGALILTALFGYKAFQKQGKEKNN